MISEDEVAWLYRCLLDRAPEQPGTISAFQAYYADFAAGRRAILASDEFRRMLAADLPEAALARAFLRRAGGAAPVPAAGEGAWGALLRPMLARHGAVRLAVVAGAPAEAVAALAEAGATIVLAEPDAPGGAPQMSPLPRGGTLFRLAIDAAPLAALLEEAGLRVDLLACAADRAAFARGLRPVLAARAIVLGAVPEALRDLPGAEPPVTVNGLGVLHIGGWFLPVSHTQRPAEAPPPGPRLTVAAIVRNEAVAIVNMIASAAPVAADFVVLDTGSTDGTMAAAEAALRATGRPYVLTAHPGGRFDDMRNAALDLVPAQSDWVLMLDADEELVPEDFPALVAAMAESSADAIALPRYNFTGPTKAGEVVPYPDRQVRLLRNTPDRRVRYAGAVHEKVTGVAIGAVPLDAAAIGGERGGPHIHHLVRRFRTPDEEARKQAFYRALAAANPEAAPAPQ